jgi:hypothetical protein
MKSSYELAMERMGEGDKPLSEEQKAKIAEIDSKYKAKIAERKIFLEKSVQDALAKGSHEEAEEARRILAQEVNSLEEKAESEKDKIRDN